MCILLGSSLGYLGLGAQPPTAEWGVLIADGKNFITTAWWMSIFPGIAIVAAGSPSACSATPWSPGWRPSDANPADRARPAGQLHDAFGLVPVVDGVDLEIGVGEVLGLVGESGSGKSVTLRAIAASARTECRGSTGSVRWHDRELTAMAEQDCVACGDARSR